MRLKEISEKTKISKRNIHFYIKEGIITPSLNPDNSYYEFTESDCQKLIFAREMRNAGLSLSNIRSLIQTPITANHYLNQFIKQLKQEQRHIEQTLISLNHMIAELPIYPDFPTLYNLCLESAIPSKTNDALSENILDYQNAAVVNQYLWAAFLPQTKLTNYQEFLWLKLNRLTLEHPSEEYLKLRNFFDSLSSSQFDQIFSQQSERFSYISALKPEEYERCSEEMISRLREGVENPQTAQIWNRYYHNFFYPTVVIHASDLSQIVMEISPFYRQYVFNIGNVCERTYQYLLSEKGSSLYQKMKAVYGNNLELAAANHGLLESLVNLPDFHFQNTALR